MAKFRLNHKKSLIRKRHSAQTARVVIYSIGLLLFCLFVIRKLSTNFNISIFPADASNYEIPPSNTFNERFYLPSGRNGQLVHHQHYSLLYNEQYETAEWVAYELRKDQLKIPNVARAKRFRPDPKISTGSPDYYDFSGSGYTRGHLAPAGDMAFSASAMEESFYLSNISAQKRAFNNGIWKELEEQVRDWAWKFNRLYVVCGPIITSIDEYTGNNKVGIPTAFYKVLLDINEPELKAIAYIIPNEISIKPIHEYACSVDEVERVTGINFFADLIDEKTENMLESTFNPTLWPVNQKRYQLRLNKWNQE